MYRESRLLKYVDISKHPRSSMIFKDGDCIVKRNGVTKRDWETADVLGICPYSRKRNSLYVKFLAFDLDVKEEDRHLLGHASEQDAMRAAYDLIDIFEGARYIIQRSKSATSLHLIVFADFIIDGKEAPAIYYKENEYRQRAEFKEFIANLLKIVPFDDMPMHTRNLWVRGRGLKDNSFELIEEGGEKSFKITNKFLEEVQAMANTKAPQKNTPACPILQGFIKNQKDQTEQIWWMLSRVAKCFGSSSVFHKWSKEHPDYDERDTEAKYRNASKIYPKCKAIVDANGGNSKLCKDCKHKNLTPMQRMDVAYGSKDLQNGIHKDIQYHPNVDSIRTFAGKIIDAIPESCFYVEELSAFYDTEHHKVLRDLEHAVQYYGLRVMKRCNDGSYKAIPSYTTILNKAMQFRDLDGITYRMGDRRVKYIIRSPSFTAGHIIKEPGIYDGVLADFEPCASELFNARYIKEFLKPYDFASTWDYIVAIGSILTAATNKFFGHQKPAFYFWAPPDYRQKCFELGWDGCNAGKSDLALCVGNVKSSEILVPSISSNSDLTELRKRVESGIMSGTQAVIFDNLQADEEVFEYSHLSVWLSSKNFQPRILGKSEIVNIPNYDVLYMITGNWHRLSRDLEKRVAYIEFAGPISTTNRKVIDHEEEGIKLACSAMVWFEKWISKGFGLSSEIFDKNLDKLQNFKYPSFWKVILSIVEANYEHLDFQRYSWS